MFSKLCDSSSNALGAYSKSNTMPKKGKKEIRERGKLRIRRNA